jgi:hypothetical protein
MKRKTVPKSKIRVALRVMLAVAVASALIGSGVAVATLYASTSKAALGDNALTGAAPGVSRAASAPRSAYLMHTRVSTVVSIASFVTP